LGLRFFESKVNVKALPRFPIKDLFFKKIYGIIIIEIKIKEFLMWIYKKEIK
jgi:hypothetical protein